MVLIKVFGSDLLNREVTAFAERIAEEKLELLNMRVRVRERERLLQVVWFMRSGKRIVERESVHLLRCPLEECCCELIVVNPLVSIISWRVVWMQLTLSEDLSGRSSSRISAGDSQGALGFFLICVFLRILSSCLCPDP